MKPQDRKNFLYNLLHLHKFEYMTKKFKAKSKENKILLKNILSQLNDEDNIEKLKNKNIDYQNKISLFEKENYDLEIKIKELRNKKEIKLTNIDNSLLDINVNIPRFKFNEK